MQIIRISRLVLNLVVTFLVVQTAVRATSGQPLANPESVISDGNRYFVSNIGQKLNADKDGDGFITEIAPDGKIIKARLFSKAGPLNAPKGMAIAGRVLYVTDIDRIVGFDLSSEKKVLDLPLGQQVKFLNDLVATGPTTLYASDTFGPALYKIDLTGKICTRIAVDVPAVNGLAYRPGKEMLYINSMGPDLNGAGRIYAYHLDQAPARLQAVDNSPQGVLDGLSFVDDDWLITSDWVSLQAGKGRLLVHQLATHQTRVLPVALRSPADLYLDARSGKLYIPQTLENKLTILEWLPGGQISRPPGSLYHYNLITPFLEGMYYGTKRYGELKKKGDFGLGAPNGLDGEITIHQGIVYQTTHTGHTFTPADTARTSFSFIHPFRPSLGVTLASAASKEALEQQLEAWLENPQSGMYAIRISGIFDSITTRAFPPVQPNGGSYPKLADMLDRQRFLPARRISGTLIGYQLPAYLSGINVPGFHFHFISDDGRHGGHLIQVRFSGPVKVEIESVEKFEVEVPVDERQFRRVEFTNAPSEAVKAVERGKK